MSEKKQTPEITPAEKRHSEALVYLNANGMDVNSITEIHYREALKIAAGIDDNINQNPT